MKPFYLFTPARRKRNEMLSYAMGDSFFAGIIHDLNDFGHEIIFSSLGGAGAYEPFSLSSEKIDTPEKQLQFADGFWSMFETGSMKASLRFSAFSSAELNAYYFLHELMHFYQDMHGLYLLPLQEQGVFPMMLDAKSDIVAIMFCEAWAQVEAIRSSWALQKKGNDLGWRGAIKSSDSRKLALAYDKDLCGGMDEKSAAANIFHLWYNDKSREFYERHALKIHKINLARFQKNVSSENINENFRKLELPMLIARLPKDGIPNYFSLIDWEDKSYSNVETREVNNHINELQKTYGTADNTNIQDIKCGSPPYLWQRLRISE